MLAFAPLVDSFAIDMFVVFVLLMTCVSNCLPENSSQTLSQTVFESDHDRQLY